MDTVAQELPYAAVIMRQFQDVYCATCLISLDDIDTPVTCDECLETSYCSMKCQRKDWRTVHQKECSILRGQKGSKPLTTHMRLCTRLLLQTQSPHSPPTFNGVNIMDLETNYDSFRASAEHNQFITEFLALVNNAGESVFPKSSNNKFTIGLICSVLCNSFALIDEKKVETFGAGLYVGLAKHNHACGSKSHIVFEQSQAILRAPDGVKYSESLTISYVSRMLPTAARQAIIRNVHFVTCRCTMCQDEQLDLIGLASRCSNQKCDGLVIGATCCQTCGAPSKLAPDQVEHFTMRLIKLLENLHKDNQFESVREEFNYLNGLRNEYQQILADSNVAILQLDEQIAYCASRMLQKPENIDKIAVRGIDHYVTRLHLGSPEVTRRYYIACLCLTPRVPTDVLHTAITSSLKSHGEHHSITEFLVSIQ